MPTLFPKDNRSVQAEIPPSGFAGNSRSNRFAFQLFAALAPGKENLAICPDGARILLSLLWSAASGETRKQMGSVLELGDGQDGNENWYERRGRPLGMTLVKAEQGEEFLTTSGLWCDQQFCLNDAFAASARTDYATEVQKGDFVSEHTLEQVNSWVSHQTRGKIARIVENLAPLGPLVAVNAVYFRGKWLESFSKRQTEEEDFFLPDSGRRKVPMMRRSDFFEYAERNGTQMVGLPYSGSLQMLVVLPPNGVKIEKFFRNCTKPLGRIGGDCLRAEKENYECRASGSNRISGLTTLYECSA